MTVGVARETRAVPAALFRLGMTASALPPAGDRVRKYSDQSS